MTDETPANKRRAATLAGGFVLIVLFVVWLLQLIFGFGLLGFAVGAAVAGATAWTAWLKSDSLVLAMSHARVADPRQHARFHNLVEGLCVASGLPKPRLYVVEDDALNAFATGRDPKHAALGVTSGLLDQLSRVELEGVLAHELSHIKSYDVLTSTLAVTMVGGAAVVCDWAFRFLWWGGPRHADDRSPRRGPLAAVAAIGVLLLVPAAIAGRVMHLAVRRNRETLADMTGVAITRYPPGLISALEKFRDGFTLVHSASPATAHLWLENPTAQGATASRLSWLNRLFNTHPPIDERIQALREL